MIMQKVSRVHIELMLCSPVFSSSSFLFFFLISFTIAAAVFLFYATHFFVARDLEDLDYGVPEVVAGVKFAPMPKQ